MQLPHALRRATPAGLKHNVRLRALAVGSGLIPPRAMHSEDEAALLQRLARGRRRVVELGVYEGGSAALLAGWVDPGTDLHLVDPFGEHPDALPAGWGALEQATRRVVARAARRRTSGTVNVHWHVALSQDLASTWLEPIDLLFIDGDHSEAGCRRDWDGFHDKVSADGVVLIHDARLGRPGGRGLPGPTAVADTLFRGPEALPGWRITDEVDRTVVVARA
ncbi:DNA methyltransferase [Paraconexibacter sp. AEG42_29]|uniref:DNA methyltransferase n=1 Tax=Paraconexibacter sp. AEG42_29 TaxID=2997339 RepID=A0AAU7B000_9ACTN